MDSNGQKVKPKKRRRRRCNTKLYECYGLFLSIQEWRDISGIDPNLISLRIRQKFRKGSIRFAIFEPVDMITQEKDVPVYCKYLPLEVWSSISGIDAKEIRYRLKNGWPPKLAIFCPENFRIDDLMPKYDRYHFIDRPNSDVRILNRQFGQASHQSTAEMHDLKYHGRYYE